MDKSALLTTIPKLHDLVRFRIVILLWGSHCSVRDETILYSIEDFIIVLASHREKINDDISRIPTEELPSLSKSYLQEGVFLFEQAYGELLKWLEKYYVYSYNNTENGSLSVLCYIKVDGHFDDLAWARWFVNDRNNLLLDRLSIACHYCLERELTVIWQEMKDTNQAPYGGNLSKIKFDVDDLIHRLVLFWIYKLENEFQNLLPDDDIDDHYDTRNFWHVGFAYAVYRGHERATCYFWNSLEDIDKDRFIESELLFELLRHAAVREAHKVVQFVYSMLSDTQKHKFFVYFGEGSSHSRLWVLDCLLQFVIPNAFINDVLHFPYSFSDEWYSDLLMNLVVNMRDLKIPAHAQAFRALWKKIRKETRLAVLSNKGCLVRMLAKAKDLDTLGLIIKGLSCIYKDSCLLSNHLNAGIFTLNVFTEEEEYDLLKQYLSFFLIHVDTNSGKESFREDAKDVLEVFDTVWNIRSWIELLQPSKRSKVNRVIDDLKDIVSATN